MEQFSEPISYFAPTNGKLQFKSNHFKSTQNRINYEMQDVSLMRLLLAGRQVCEAEAWGSTNFHGLLSKNNIGKIPRQYLDKEFLISSFCNRGSKYCSTNFHRFFSIFNKKIPKKYSHLRHKYICPSTLFFCVEFDRLQSFRSCQCETCEKERHFHMLLYKLDEI